MDEADFRSVRRAYRVVAAEYAKRSFAAMQTRSSEHVMLDLFMLYARGVVCDLGCGAGQVAHYLRAHGQQVVGVDLSPEMLSEARRRNPGVEFIESHLGQLPVPDESWGGVVAFCSLVHLPRAEVPQALLEIRRVLQGGGLLLLSFHVGQGTHHSTNWWGILPTSLDYTCFSVEEMHRFLQETGFGVEVTRSVGTPPNAFPRAYILARKAATFSAPKSPAATTAAQRGSSENKPGKPCQRAT